MQDCSQRHKRMGQAVFRSLRRSSCTKYSDCMEKSAFPLRTDCGVAAAGKRKSLLKNRNKQEQNSSAVRTYNDHLVQVPDTPGRSKSWGILLRALPKSLLSTDRLGAFTTSLGNLFSVHPHLLAKKCFPKSHPNPCSVALDHSHVSCHWIPGRRAQHFRKPQEQWAHHPSASFSPHWTNPESSDIPHRIFLPVFSPALIPFSGLCPAR